MSKRKKTSSASTMLELWRPPRGAGEPVGCLASTYTFAPGLFDEQSLARFLDIGSEPNREDLAFLLERETRLGGVYAAVLVDQAQAGVEHSLRWDVLPVRVPNAKQHAKLSLLAWSRHLRIIVASANLTEPGYRSNQEVAGAVDLTPEDSNAEILADTIDFLRHLIALVPGASGGSPEVLRAERFLAQVRQQARGWKQGRKGRRVKQYLVFTVPMAGNRRPARSSLEEAIDVCRRRWGSPSEARIASPFFDPDEDTSPVTTSLCRLMARGIPRQLCFCVPASTDGEQATPRLAGPKTLMSTPRAFRTDVTIRMLPEVDADENRRTWHAKMLALQADRYSALMIGSSNFTGAGMGVGRRRNAEANLLTIVDRAEYGREAGQLDSLWPNMKQVIDPESAEWLGARPEEGEEDQKGAPPLSAGFLAATYRAGEERAIVVRLDPDRLPETWTMRACGANERGLLSASDWRERGRRPVEALAWEPAQPPEKLLVRWGNHQAFLPLNVEDVRSLPPPAELEAMSADDMLEMLAASDPSAAFRAWSRRREPQGSSDADLDSATPIDLDPLRRYDLEVTFLHRIGRRARILAQMRSNLERPVWGRLALESRLCGPISPKALTERFLREFLTSGRAGDEALLALADLLIVLSEVNYRPGEGSLPKAQFTKAFQAFLAELATNLDRQIDPERDRVGQDVMRFWKRVTRRCRT